MAASDSMLNKVSATNFKISSGKYAMKNVSIFMIGKFRNLIKFCKKYEGTKCRTFAWKQKFLPFSSDKNNSQK